MAVSKRISKTSVRDQRGQSLLEFVLVLPMLLGLSTVLLRVNSAMQMSIVNQQYARAQALGLADHSSNYPSLRFTGNFVGNKLNQMLIGVSDNIAGPNYVPKASVQTVARKPGLGSLEEKREPTLRGDVRIRTSVLLCTQSYVLADGTPLMTFQLGGSGARPANISTLNESSHFEYCKGGTP